MLKMKKIFFTLITVATLVACKSGDKKTTGDKLTADSTKQLTSEEKQKAGADSANFTTIQWIDSTTKQLGNLKKDQSIEITYRFKNAGDKTLVIEDVTAQCGCTIPEKPAQPIAPGEEGIIKAKFNGSGSGVITKQVYVKANTKPAKDHTLTFTGEIK
jgi:uncharacterized protein YcfL